MKKTDFIIRPFKLQQIFEKEKIKMKKYLFKLVGNE